MLDWLAGFELFKSLTRVWSLLNQLYIGEIVALISLAAVTFIGSIAATNRFFACEFAWPKPRKPQKQSKRPKGFGIKYVILLLVALLPGGLVGTFAVYSIMGKDNWRRDAFWIVGMSLVPALLLMLLRAAFFPWPALSNAIYVSGIIGLSFGVLQLWALIKLLREWFGEPDECIGWWPPVALWAQGLLLFAALYRLLES